MKADAAQRLGLLVSFVVVVLSAPAHGREQRGTPSPLETRDEREAFLSKASFVSDAPPDGRPSWRAGLDDGSRKHDASVVTDDGSGPTGRNYRFNLAAYELDKLLGLNLVPPSVERLASSALTGSSPVALKLSDSTIWCTTPLGEKLTQGSEPRS